MNQRAGRKLRVVLADDHAIFRHGLRAVLELVGELEVVDECGDGDAALASYAKHRPDVLLLDLRMPRLDGLEVVRCVLETDRAARILVMTTYNTDEDIGHALRAGAKGYLLKDAAPEDVCRAIARVAEGGMFLAPDVAEQYVQLSTRPELSQRELQILRMVGQGKPNKQIARDLSVEVTTVKGHVKSVFEKLGVRNRTEALAEATRRGNGVGGQLMYPESRSEVQRLVEMRSRASRATLSSQSTCELSGRGPAGEFSQSQEIVMHQATDHSRRASGYELRFRSLSKPGSGYTFPCDASGTVDLDTLSETGRTHYFFARTLIGSEFCMPKVIPAVAR